MYKMYIWTSIEKFLYNDWTEAPFNDHFQPSFRRHNIRFAHISDQFELTNQHSVPQQPQFPL